MSLITQIKADLRKSDKELVTARKRLTKADAQVRTAAAALQKARDEVNGIEAEQTKLNQMLKLEDGGKARAKPGPKAKGVHKATRKVRAKVKAAVQTRGRKSKGVNQSRAAQGRREVAQKLRPPIKDTIAKVLGKRVMHADAIHDAIKENGQLPNSNNPRGYIGYLLSASKIKVKRGGREVEVHQFERVAEKGRGFYKNYGVTLSKAALKAASEKPEAPKVKAKPGPKPKAAKAAKPATKAATKDGKRTVICKVCGKAGHNSRGHDKWAAKQAGTAETKPAKTEETTRASKPEKKAAATKDGKRTVICKVCGQPGHNSRGHAKAVGSTTTAEAAPKTNGHDGPATPAPATKKDEDKSTDEILADAGIELPAAVSP